MMITTNKQGGDKLKRVELKKARVDEGLTQEALASELSVHVDHIRSLEYGRVNPSVKLMNRICDRLKGEPRVLFPDL
ncbi:helix-turn-helix transcriptional regulator [Paenibacillus sp. Leaf72]|uniref:helix-turn-helix transcriptional regulator n=1 Tax=Paenibacillus sp. Leaf72 TaxID=1736234 RepID=UPI0009D73871|nr:helix-turn-helix transcriptional regulator [Paenibacillus sp. Leaf72]